jgi:hypothetical protein
VGPGYGGLGGKYPLDIPRCVVTGERWRCTLFLLGGLEQCHVHLQLKLDAQTRVALGLLSVALNVLSIDESMSEALLLALHHCHAVYRRGPRTMHARAAPLTRSPGTQSRLSMALRLLDRVLRTLPANAAHLRRRISGFLASFLAGDTRCICHLAHAPWHLHHRTRNAGCYAGPRACTLLRIPQYKSLRLPLSDPQCSQQALSSLFRPYVHSACRPSPMAPVALTPQADTTSPAYLKQQVYNGQNGHAEADVKEDWTGDYRFAPIQEAEVSRAMIKRWGWPSTHLSMSMIELGQVLQHDVRPRGVRRCDHRCRQRWSLGRVPPRQDASGSPHHHHRSECGSWWRRVVGRPAHDSDGVF